MADDESMDLKAFVTTTLVQIIEGVEDAIKRTQERDTTARINPTVSHAHHSNPTPVQFDVAVTVTDSKSGGGRGGIRVASIEIGGGIDKKAETQAVSRIQFSVPVSMPCMAGQQFAVSGGSPGREWRSSTNS